MISNLRKPQASGFTLAELLIALAILGIIAVFTIPKLLNAQADARNKALFKEDFALISGASATLMNRGLNTTGSDDYVVFETLINYTKTVHTGANINEVNFWLANGSTLISFNGSMAASGNTIGTDANGAAGPNQNGVDRLTVFVCWAYKGCPSPTYGTDHFIRGGEISYVSDTDVAGKALFLNLFDN